jgi:hypothetical protein
MLYADLHIGIFPSGFLPIHATCPAHLAFYLIILNILHEEYKPFSCSWQGLHPCMSIYQKGAYYSGVKIFNKLPSNIKNVNGDITKFKTTLKKFICELILHTRRVFWARMALVLSIEYLNVFIMAYLSILELRIFFINPLFMLVSYVYCSSTHALPIRLIFK